MNASADLQVALASSRCGFKQLDILPNVACGQNCLMSFAHSLAVQEAFARIVEQPTDNSLTCKCKQPRTRPPPGMTRGHRDQMSAVQSRSEVNSASCASAQGAPSANIAPSATALNVVLMIASFLAEHARSYFRIRQLARRVAHSDSPAPGRA